MDNPETISFSRRNLPHWRVIGRSYFVTFRLHGSLSKLHLAKIRNIRDRLNAINDDNQRLKLHRNMFRILESAALKVTRVSENWNRKIGTMPGVKHNACSHGSELGLRPSLWVVGE